MIYFFCKNIVIVCGLSDNGIYFFCYIILNVIVGFIVYFCVEFIKKIVLDGMLIFDNIV